MRVAKHLNRRRFPTNFWIFIAVLLVGCGQGDKIPKGNSAIAAPPVTVSGQVFVVTAGRDNIKLALVEVYAIAESLMPEYIRKKHENGLEQQKLLKPNLEATEREATEAARAERVSTANYRDGYNRNYERAVEAIKRKGAKELAFKLAKLEFENFDSPEYYLTGLPTPVGVSKTDADGKFTLTVPPGKYVIAAMANRKVFNGTENYSWLVKVDTSSTVQSLMLSNDNQIETNCKDCVTLPKGQL